MLPEDRKLPMLPETGLPRRPMVLRRLARRREDRTASPAVASPPVSPLQCASEKIADAVIAHLPMLARRRLALVVVDADGVADTAAWQEECRVFAERVIRPRLTTAEAEAATFPGLGRLIAALIEDPARLDRARLEAGLRYHPGLSPLAYERFCAARLTAAGWSCQPAPRGGGADLLARRDGITLAVLCRKSNSLIAARVVEEAAGARARLGASHVAVVSNAPFTRSALMLGDSLGALMLNHAELDLLEAGLDDADQGIPSGKRWVPSVSSGSVSVQSTAATGNAA
ncbi:MAG TPA: restriction endonuclease [Acetobacteraceae bacterium]|nr:restriction endonuclease [Acetobacteraceae bacterium]